MSRNRTQIRWNKPESSSSLSIFVAIAEAAKIKFSESYSQASTNHIAELAGVSVASLYRYFENKESILTYLVEEFINETRAEVSKVALESGELEFQAFIKNIMKFGFARYTSNAGFLRVMYQHGGELGLTEKIFSIRSEIAHNLAGIIREKYIVEMTLEELKDKLLTSMNAFMGVVQGQAMANGGMFNSAVLESFELTFNFKRK